MDSKSLSKHPFFANLFERVEGLIAIIVTDGDGNLHIKAINKQAKNDDGARIDFDTTLSTAYAMAAEQVRYIFCCFQYRVH